jgi:hypothetical protein
VHHIIFAPKTVIGRATPVSPPGTLSQGTILKQTVNPSKFPKVRPIAALERAYRSLVAQSTLRVKRALDAVKTRDAVKTKVDRSRGVAVASASVTATDKGQILGNLSTFDAALEQFMTGKLRQA